uniref:O-acyltransferase WSD1-like n=1 Tax=Rhizophora mucronata TaxID=61149 RepID=A0A2P2JC34_RHIMU
MMLLLGQFSWEHGCTWKRRAKDREKQGPRHWCYSTLGSFEPTGQSRRCLSLILSSHGAIDLPS